MKQLILYIFLFTFSISQAQDARFSQFLSTPLLLNPSLTGVFDQDYRVIANYRNQWKTVSTPYETFAVSADIKPFNRSARSRTNFGAGILLTSDKAGDLNFRTNSAYLSLAGSFYFLKTRQTSSYVSLGFQVGHVASSLDWSAVKLAFPNQMTVGFEQTNYLDVSVGGTWVYANRQFLIYLGGAAYHFHQPMPSFLENNQNTLSTRYVGHFGGEFKINSGLTFLPSALYQQQGTASEIVAGGFLKFGQFQSKEGADLYLGTWYRLQDAVIISFRYATNNLMLTLSYDANVSTLVEASGNFGALELGLSYQGAFQRRGTGRGGKVQCPTF